MAKIKMDISEYESIKENKRLLENSLEKERILQEQIKRLTDEKTKVLEDAKMRVVKITKSQSVECILRKKDDSYIWRNLYDMAIRRFHKPGVCDLNSRNDYFVNTDRLIDIFFDKVTTYSVPVEETTTYGLDEVKTEIRNELKSRMDDETKNKIQSAENVLIKNGELLKENKILLSENEFLVEQNKMLNEQYDKVSLKCVDMENANIKFEKIKTVLKNGYTCWNKSELLNQIISIIKIN